MWNKKFFVFISLFLLVFLVSCSKKENNNTTNPNNQNTTEEYYISNFDMFSEKDVNWYGRIEEVDENNNKTKCLRNTLSGFEVKFYGTGFKVKMKSVCNFEPCAYVKVYVDDEEDGVFYPLNHNNEFYTYILCSDLEEKDHKIKVLKATEEDYSMIYVSEMIAEKFIVPDPKPEIKIDVYGDSITAGYGILKPIGSKYDMSTTDGTLTYASKLGNLLNAQVNVMCMQGISLNTGYHRTDYYLRNAYKYYSIKSKTLWDFNLYIPDLIIINIGTNDQNAIAGNNDLITDFIEAYSTLIDNLHKKSPNASFILVYNMMPMNQVISRKIVQMANEYDYVYTYEAKLVDEAIYGHPGVITNNNTALALKELIDNNNLIK